MEAHATLQRLRVRPPRRLDLDYAPEMPDPVIAHLEVAARHHGLSLARLELLGQDAQAATGFVQAVVERRADSWLDDVDWQRLEQARSSRSALN